MEDDREGAGPYLFVEGNSEGGRVGNIMDGEVRVGELSVGKGHDLRGRGLAQLGVDVGVDCHELRGVEDELSRGSHSNSGGESVSDAQASEKNATRAREAGEDIIADQTARQALLALRSPVAALIDAYCG